MRKNNPKLSLGYKMDDTFKIFVHRLKDGHQEKIEESLDPSFLDINEKDLKFSAPVEIEGNASFADGMLVLHLSVETEASMSCAICNQPCPFKISIPHFYYTIPLEEIKGSVFNYQNALREAILIEIPYTTECNSGDCPERASLAKYITPKGDQNGSTT